MNKKISAILAATIATAMMALPASAKENTVNVTVDGVPVAWTDAVPYVDENNRTMVPLRAAAEAMGLEVEWIQEAKAAVFIERGESFDEAVLFTVGEREYSHWRYNGSSDGKFTYETIFGDGFNTPTEERWVCQQDINGGDFPQMDTVAVVKDGRSYAPVRYLAEAFDYTVTWGSATKTVFITSASYVPDETSAPATTDPVKPVPAKIENVPEKGYATFKEAAEAHPYNLYYSYHLHPTMMSNEFKTGWYPISYEDYERYNTRGFSSEEELIDVWKISVYPVTYRRVEVEIAEGLSYWGEEIAPPRGGVQLENGNWIPDWIEDGEGYMPAASGEDYCWTVEEAIAKNPEYPNYVYSDSDSSGWIGSYIVGDDFIYSINRSYDTSKFPTTTFSTKEDASLVANELINDPYFAHWEALGGYYRYKKITDINIHYSEYVGKYFIGIKSVEVTEDEYNANAFKR